jgi:glycosyltransferase involved in cell wall biosynthesis
MKIIIVGTAYPLRGGIAHFNALLAEHLSGNHSVETITFKRQYPGFLFPGKSQEEQGEPLSVTPAPQLIDSVNPLNWVMVGRFIKRKQPDLVIFKYWLPFFGPCFGTIASTVKQNPHTKVLFICDNIIPHERRPGDVLFTRYAFKRADYFIVQSNAVERELLKYFPGVHYRNVPHPLYENFGTPVPKSEARKILGIRSKRVVLYFGYVRAYKGLLVLIEAMKRLQEHFGEGDEILLLAVGEFYDDEKKYRTRVTELHLGNAVRFVPDYVPNDWVATYFGAADIVVLPYLSATQSGIAQIAYNFDKPLIVTDVGGLSEIVVENTTGYIVPPDNPAEIARALIRYYTEGKEIEFTAAVQREKKKYSWDYFIKNLEGLVFGNGSEMDGR